MSALIDTPVLTAVARLVRVGISVIELVDPDDPDSWVITFNNPAGSEASRTDVERFRGKRFLEAFPAVRDTPFIDYYKQVQRTQQELELPEIRYGDDKVPEAAFRVWLTPLPGRSVLGQYVNVTEQRRAEEHLRQANAELEARVLARTAELQRARRSLQEVANAAAHDLATPVHNVLVLTDLLSRHAPDVEPQLVGRIRASARHARLQLDALLAYTDIVPGEVPRKLDPQEVIASACERLRSPADMELRVRVEVPELECDRRLFEVIVFELLSNAYHYRAPEHPAEVDLSFEHDGAESVLTIRDQGRGIAAEQHERVFSAFYRLHDNVEHAGMGLALVRQAVEACGARLTLQSAAGEGTTFTVRFPESFPTG